MIGPVYEDPRGKISRDGNREHCFIVRRGSFVDVHRFDSRERAEAARESIA